jgi:hypothetical protein
MTVLLVAVHCTLALGQAPPAIFEIDVANYVEYQSDISDPSKLATNPSITPSVQPRNFFEATALADIVAVNGQPGKGTFAGHVWVLRLNPASNPANAGGPGAAIADTQRVAFLDARGQFGGAASTATAPRAASMAEDPTNRRVNGGGGQRFVLHVIPMSEPQIVATSTGPAVTHSSDFTLVTASKPAAAGEVLSLFATGLGPARPGVDPGQPFPSSPPSAVNSPVQVTVNGKPAEVLGAVGFPGTVDG